MTATRTAIPISESAKPLRRTNVTVEELDDEALIYDSVTADTHRLNRTAYFVWRACDGRTTPRQIAESLTKSFEVSLDEATAHAERIVGEFIERGLVFVDPLSEG